MIFSLLHLVLMIRALSRSVSDGFLFGIVGGVVLLVVGVVLAVKQTPALLLPGLNLNLILRSSTEAPSLGLSVGVALVSVLGPALTFTL